APVARKPAPGALAQGLRGPGLGAAAPPVAGPPRDTKKTGPSVLALFLLQKALLARGAPPVAADAAVRADDAVTGDEDGHRVVGTGLRHGTHRAGCANGAGDVLVACRLSRRNGLKGLPDAQLESRSLDVQGHAFGRPWRVHTLHRLLHP